MTKGSSYVAAVEAALSHYLLELAGYIGRDLDEVFRIAAEESQLMQIVQSAQFGYRLRVVVDGYINQAVIIAPIAATLADDQQGGRLHASAIASGGLPSLERSYQSFSQRALAISES